MFWKLFMRALACHFVNMCVPTGGTLPSLCPNTASVSFNLKCSLDTFYDSWRNLRLIKVGGCAHVCHFMHIFNVFLRQKRLWTYLFFLTALCPNALHKRRLDSLRFLMYKRFVDVSDGAGSGLAWRPTHTPSSVSLIFLPKTIFNSVLHKAPFPSNFSLEQQWFVTFFSAGNMSVLVYECEILRA